MDPLNENKYGRGSLYLSKATSRHDTAQYPESVVGKDYYISSVVVAFLFVCSFVCFLS